MMICMPLEKITDVLKNRYDIFLKIWQPFTEYIEDVNFVNCGFTVISELEPLKANANIQVQWLRYLDDRYRYMSVRK